MDPNEMPTWSMRFSQISATLSYDFEANAAVTGEKSIDLFIRTFLWGLRSNPYNSQTKHYNQNSTRKAIYYTTKHAIGVAVPQFDEDRELKNPALHDDGLYDLCETTSFL